MLTNTKSGLTALRQAVQVFQTFLLSNCGLTKMKVGIKNQPSHLNKIALLKIHP